MYFGGKARTPNMDGGYKRYQGRSVKTPASRILTKGQYGDIVRAFCGMLAKRLEKEGTIDLPCNMGSIVAVRVRRNPTFDRKTKKWRTADVVDYEKTRETGDIVRKDCRTTFGFLFSPRREKGYENLRCYGIRANKQLYQRMRKMYDDCTLPFYLNDSDIYV